MSTSISNIQQKDRQYVASTYARFPLEIVSGKGSEVYDRDGKRYIDMGSGIGVTSFGIADDEWIAAVTAQLSRVQHMSNLYYTEPCANLAQLLCEKTGMSKVFFSNSGAEANECAIKVARKYAAEYQGADCYTIVTLENSFHGRTLTTLAATGQDHYHELFQPLTPGFVHVPAGDMEALRAVCQTHRVAAVMIECIRGEGGVLPLDAAYAQALGEFVRERDILLIVDEVQTGNGRAGAMYAYMNYGLAPDIVSTAKGLGGGLPLGATLLSSRVEHVLGHGDHGSTFGGNPIACAGACSIVRRIDDALLNEVRRKGDLIRDLLCHAPGVIGISGMGLMLGIQTKKAAADVVRTCLAQGVLCLTAKDKVRLLPALNIPEPLLREAVDVIRAACCED